MGYALNNTKLKAQHEPLEASPDIKKSYVSIDQSFIELEDSSFLDSLLNFDGWVEDYPNSSLADVMNSEGNPNLDLEEQMNSSEINKQKEDVCESEKVADLGSLIQEQIGRVCLTSGAAEVIDLKEETNNVEVVSDVVENVNENGVKDDDEDDDVDVDVEADNVEVVSDVVENVNENGVKDDDDIEDEDEDENEDVDVDVDVEANNVEVVSDVVENVNENGVKDDDDIEDEDEDEDEDVDVDVDVDVDTEEDESSSSSSSSSDDDEEEEESAKREVEMEEGEIRDEVLAWSDDDVNGDTVKGPIRSANEVQDLPPVPPVTVTIQPHHQTVPVGAVLSIMGSQVVVEGVENHKPLGEGSILWITESRSPLGVVDEIFGPVKNPYYIVRFNSETEIPSGIQQGNLISFVPEFADYVLNNNNLYKKGYDASGENDEECSEAEFSDDEKEAEYKSMIKMAKRGSTGEKNGGMKKDKKSRNRGGNWKNDQQPSASGPNNGTNSVPNNEPNNGPASRPNSGPNNGPTSGPYAFPQAPNIMPSGVWPYGFTPIQPQNIGFLPNGQPQNIGFPPNGLSSNVPPFMQQNFIQQPFQNPQFNTAPGPMFPGNFVQGVPPNFGAFASWPSGMPQNNFNQSQVGPPMVFPGLPQGVAMPNGLQMENNNGAVRPFVAVGNGENSQNPNQGNGFSNRGGRVGQRFQRGGGRFRGGRGGPRSR